MAIDPTTGQADYVDELQLMSTHRDFTRRPFAVTGDTSAAAAQCARMAALIHDAYPDLWPETVRALLVHSAAWTNQMSLGQSLWEEPRSRKKELLRTYGYGVPDLGRALRSARNRLTLIAQDRLQPFDRQSSRGVSKEMRVHKLPWPVEALRDLGADDVTLRLTLSYFIEPSPAERGWKQRHRYASHALRFDVKTPDESETDFRRRLSAAAREGDDSEPLTRGDQERWLLGSQLRHRGSVHSDRWRGSAVELADRAVGGVFPVMGWWRERHQLERWNAKARYSLVVSLETAAVTADIYTPVAVQLGVPIAIES